MRAGERLDYLASMRLWLTPGMGVKRHVMLAILGAVLMLAGTILTVLWLLAENRAVVSQPLEEVLVSPFWRSAGGWLSGATALLGIALAVAAIGRLNRSLLSNWMARPHEAAKVLHRRLQLARGPRIVALGGGTGLSNLLRGLRDHTSNSTAIVTVSDDGGSSGRLRAAFEMPAPGDLADCLAALSDNELEVSRLMQYRFERGGELAGHTFGNLLITTLTEVEGDMGRAVRVLNGLLNLAGSVYPATDRTVTLCATKRSGERVAGESQLRVVGGATERVELEPSDPPALPEAVQAIREADLVVLGPGSLFTSTLPPLLVPEVGAALHATGAELVYVCNIMTEAGETDGFSVREHVESLAAHLGMRPSVVLVNSRAVDPSRLASYRAEGAEVVADDAAGLEADGVDVVRLPLLGEGVHAQHDSEALAGWLAQRAALRRARRSGDAGLRPRRRGAVA